MPGCRFVGIVFFLLAAGCAGVENTPPREASVSGGAQEGAIGGRAVVRPTVPPVTPPTTPVTPPTTRPPDQSVATTSPPAAKTPLKAPASPAATEQPLKKESAAPDPGKKEASAPKQEASPPLNLASLEQRLRDTKAIGVFTKLALKNQVDDLLTQFRAFHQGRVGAILTQLREEYNLLLLKVLSLLQDGDPVLARAIAGSREAIWGILVDPVKFATL